MDEGRGSFGFVIVADDIVYGHLFIYEVGYHPRVRVRPCDLRGANAYVAPSYRYAVRGERGDKLSHRTNLEFGFGWFFAIGVQCE